MNLNRHIILVGLPGVGKTSIGYKLSILLKIDYIDIDSHIQESKKITISKFIEQNGEASFRVLEKKILKGVLNKKSPCLVSSGGGIILDLDNQNLIIEKSFGIHIKCNLNELESRLDTSNRPLLYNTNKSEKLLDMWNERSKLYNKVSKIEVDITGIDIDTAALKVHNMINVQEKLLC